MFEADLDGDGNINYEEFITMIFKEVLQSIICILFYMINDKCFIGNMHIMWLKDISIQKSQCQGQDKTQEKKKNDGNGWTNAVPTSVWNKTFIFE